MDSTLVIKVKYGDTLRRFNAYVNESGQLDLDMSGLRAKILGLFDFPLSSDLTLTYVDEDGDVVTLVDDDDLLDVMKQNLKILRVNVQLNNDKFSKSYAKSSGSSTPMRSPRVQDPLPNINLNAADVLKSFPEPFRESLSKISLGLTDLTSKVAAPSPVISEVLDCLLKMAKASLNPSQQSQVGASSSIQTEATEHPMALEVPTETNATNDEPSWKVRVADVVRGVGVPVKPVPASVDLNLDPSCDSNPSGCTNVISASTPRVVDGKATKEKNDGQPSEWPSAIGASSSSTDSAMPLGNECPFGGMHAVNHSSSNSFMLPRIISSRRRNGRNGAMVGMFHRGVQCDGCGVHPITGPRYKSKVREDYDLCSICFGEMGNEADYIKMDRPVFNRHPRAVKGLRYPAQKVGPPLLSTVIKHCGIKPGPVQAKLDSRFILDVNVLDGTMMAPSTPFTKIWRLRNSGSVVWPKGTRLVWIGGDRFSHADSAGLEIPADGVPVDGELDIAVDFTSPKLPGRYISYWRMVSPSGLKFGQRVWVLIQVDASIKDSVRDGVEGLNLNLPPDCSGSKFHQIIDVNLQPAMDSGFQRPCNSSVSVPMVDVEQPMKDQEMNFPINDILFVGDGISTPTPNQASSSVSYPIIDFSEAARAVPSEVFPAMDIPTSSEDVIVKDTVEKSLLKELEEMGFKQIDLNKEILRMNEYNLEQSVDDLCGVSDWDPILEELQEMGFPDKEMNRKLLKKNNGSIKRVVMDLLTGEKA